MWFPLKNCLVQFKWVFLITGEIMFPWKGGWIKRSRNQWLQSWSLYNVVVNVSTCGPYDWLIIWMIDSIDWRIPRNYYNHIETLTVPLRANSYTSERFLSRIYRSRFIPAMNGALVFLKEFEGSPHFWRFIDTALLRWRPAFWPWHLTRWHENQGNITLLMQPLYKFR